MEAVLIGFFVLLFIGGVITNFILLIVFHSKTTRRLGALMKVLEHINDQIKKGGSMHAEETTIHPTAQPEPKKEPETVTPAEPIKPVEPEPKLPEQKVPEAEKIPVAAAIKTDPVGLTATIQKPPKKEHPKTDWEKFFGEKLAIFAGIGILVLGIAFFVRLAIQNNWINEYGRVAVGYISGGILLFIAHYFRHKFKTFSSVLVGGGLAVMYFTTAIAFHEYHIFSQTNAFILMVIITLGAIALSLAYDRRTLAILALLGGFLTPYIVSTGTGNYIVLFTYLSILNIGLLLLSYFRRWRFLHILAFTFTAIFYASWLGGRYAIMEVQPVSGAFIYASIFYIIFFLMGIVSTLRSNKRFDGWDILVFMLNSFLFFIVGLYILDTVADGQYRGIFTASVAVVNFIAASRLWKNINVSKNLVYLLIGLVMTFVSLIAPVQLSGSYITIFWAAEAAVLLWLWKHTGFKLTAIFSAMVTICMYISLAMDWEAFSRISFDPPPFAIASNPYFITGIMASLSLYVIARLLNGMTSEKIFWFIPAKTYRRVVWCLFHLITFTVLVKEINYQLYHFTTLSSVTDTVLGVYIFGYSAMLSYLARKWSNIVFKAFMLFTNVPLILTYLFSFSFSAGAVRNEFISQGKFINIFFIHYLTVALVIWLIVWSAKTIRDFSGERKIWNTLFLWFITFCGVFILSAELLNIMALGFSSNVNELAVIKKRVVDAGFPILWGLCAILLINLGIRYKKRVLRVISLTLIGVTMIKLAFTVARMSQGVQVAAFIGLGLILLFISFIYQKLNLLSSDTTERSE